MSAVLARLNAGLRTLVRPGARRLQHAVQKDWRTHFCSRLHGRGIEFGALQRPMPQHAGMTVEYSDKLTLPELRAHYPEHDDVALIAPDIVDDAETMSSVADLTYDFVIAAHVFEHLKNPIQALANWCRILKAGGLVYLVVPDKRHTFDRLRVCTTLEHLILDYVRPSADRDYEHYLDYSTWVHGKRGHEALDDARQLHARDYSIHFHVFEPPHVQRILEWFGANVRPLTVLEGPAQSAGSDEFHFLFQVPGHRAS